MAVIPDTNVNLATNIRDVLNAAGGSVGNNVISFFKPDAKIDKWARFKPTIYYGLDFPNGTEEPKQWQARDGLCGFDESSILFNSTSALVSAFNNDSVYTYLLPTGGTAAPLRLGDFRGYKTDAVSPVWSFDYTGQIYANDSSSSSTFTILGNSSIDTDKNLQMKDILPDGVSSLSEFYFGVVIADKSGSVKETIKSGSKLGPDAGFNSNVTLSQSQLGTPGNYIAYPCFIDAKGSQFVAAPTGLLEFEVLASADAEKLGWMEGTGEWTIDDRFKYKGTLAYTSSWEGQNVYISLQVDGKDDGQGQTVTLSHDSVSADGKNYYMTYSRSVIKADTGASYRLRCGYGNGWLNNAYLKLDYVNPEEFE